MKNKTFLELIAESLVVVPEIQRDYAQGREDKKIKEIRNNFLNALIEKLSDAQDNSPMVLDFIYGSILQGKFVPLDGQQRLTTLFLLHWYLIPKESKLLVNSDDSSKFTYQTRISSKDFCNELVKNNLSDIKYKIEAIKEDIQNRIGKLSDNNQSEAEKERLNREYKSWRLSKGIVNQKWFAWSWRQDPTIKAMLVMLDAIDEKVATMDTNLMWARLSQRSIVFHLLYLSDFNLSDELYVKMNARGKELSSFDIFKSSLEEQMRINDVKQEIQDKWRESFDSSWMDIFWNKVSKRGIGTLDIVENVERNFLRFLKRMMVFHIYSETQWLNKEIVSLLNTHELKRLLPFEFQESQNLMNKIREYSVRNDVLDLMPFFCKTGFFNDDFFEFIIATFSSIVYEDQSKCKREISDQIEGIYFEQSSQNLFDVFVDDKINYDARIQYYAVIQFAKHNSGESIIHNDAITAEFLSWMRIVRNLTTNTNSYFYNTWEDFGKSSNGITSLSSLIYEEKQYESIVSMLASDASILGWFDASQMGEEYKKAQLMIKSENKAEWTSFIRQAEEHKYLVGQINFLLDWAREDIVKANSYFNAFCLMFGSDGISEELTQDYLFKRALMCANSWYLLNDCFMFDKTKNRDWSWKRYLRDINKAKNIQCLFDSYIVSDESNVLNWIIGYINTNKLYDWRKCFIEYNKIFDELYDKKITWWYWNTEKSDGEICLLSKTRRSSKHKELRTYYWHLKFKIDGDYYLDSKSETNPFAAVFKRNDNKITVQFLPKWDNGWVEGSYVIHNENTNQEHCINSSEYEKAEEYLREILML